MLVVPWDILSGSRRLWPLSYDFVYSRGPKPLGCGPVQGCTFIYVISLIITAQGVKV